jgi:Lrp/AsnC family leucine-responsive transcriptional regulator
MADDRDRQILRALQEDAWLSYGELGERVSLSASAAQRRVEKLIAFGVIRGASARVEPDALGRPLRIYVLVELKDERSATINEFARALRRHADIVEAHYVAGSADIIVVMQTATMADYARFAEHNLNDHPGVRRYQTLSSLRRLR